MNVLDPIARFVRAYPDLPALHARGRTLTFRELWQSTGLVAHNLDAAGVKRGDGVALSRLPPHVHFIAILAVARLGAVSTSVPPSMPLEERRAVVRRHGLRFWVHGEPKMPPSSETIRFIPESDLLKAPTGRTRAIPLERGLDDQVWRICFSSGTTGTRKSIPWTHGQRAALERDALGVATSGPGDALLVCGDLGTNFALGQALTHMGSGGALALPDNATPSACVEALRAVKPARLLMSTAMALTLTGHLQKQAGHEGPFPGLLSMLVGGSAVSPSLMQSLEALVCRNILVAYGSSEIGSTARSTAASRLAVPGSAGSLVPWVEAEAVDDQDRPLAPGSTGLLRFRPLRGAMSSGYLGDPEATARSFRNGWFYPGDVGMVDANRILTLGGRKDDIVNLGGRKVDPTSIETLLNSQPGVVESAVVPVQRAGAEGRMLVGAVVSDGKADLEAIGTTLAAQGHRIRMLVGVSALPKNANGKVLRGELARQLAKSLPERR